MKNSEGSYEETKQAKCTGSKVCFNIKTDTPADMKQSFDDFRADLVDSEVTVPKVLNADSQRIFVSAFLDQGPKMTETVSKVPLTLVTSDDAGLKGALFKALKIN